MKFLGTFLFFYISWSEIMGMSPNSGHLNSSMFDGLIKYLKEDSKLHQIAFILDDLQNSTDPVIDSLITRVNSHFPSIIIRCNSDVCRTDIENSYENLLKQSRSTTLFVYQVTDTDYMHKIHDLIITDDGIFTSSPKPRFLILNPFPMTQDEINEDLDHFWYSQFLDITLLTYDNPQLQTRIESCSPVLPILNQVNPFFKNYTSQVISSESEWFPNKLRDMNGYRVNVSIQPANDSSQEEFNRGIKLLNILQKVMNFQPNLEQIYSENGKVMRMLASPYYFHFMNENRNKLDALKPQIILNLQKIWQNDEGYLSCSRVLRLSHVRAVIPNEMKVSRDITISSEFWYMISVTIGTICIIRLLAYLLKFRRSTWQTLNISQIIMGATASEEPDTFPARIMFGSLLIACIVYTGYFYSVILDISFQSIPVISNFTELTKSHIKPIVSLELSATFQFFKRTNIDDWLVQIYDKKYLLEHDCLKFLNDYRNVTCLLEDAAHHVNSYQTKNGLMKIKILKRPFNSGFCVFEFDIRSPYAEKFNEIILKASGFGLLREFYEERQNLQSSPQEAEYITKEKLLPVLLFVLIGGYSLATIAFLLELITAKLRRVFYKPKFRFVN